MTKEEFDKSLTELVASMIDLNYAQGTIDRALMWLAVSQRQALVQAVVTIQDKLNEKPGEEEFDFWMGEYGESIRIKHTSEEKRKIIEERRKTIRNT